MASLTDAPGVFLGSALAGSLASGAPVVDVMQSFQGSVGATVGYLAGTLVWQSNGDLPAALPFITAAAVPLIAGGVVDRGLLGLVVGAFVGAVIQRQILKPKDPVQGQQ